MCSCGKFGGVCSQHADEMRAELAHSIPVEQVRALVRLLYPEEMTPIAKRQFDNILGPVDEVSGSIIDYDPLGALADSDLWED